MRLSTRLWSGPAAPDARCARQQYSIQRIDFSSRPPHRIYQAWRRGRFQLITATLQLDELRRASRYPKFRAILQPHRVGQMLNNLQRATTVDRLPTGPEIADPDDAWLLALADTGNADYLVTGDKRSGLLKYSSIGRARILTASAFCNILD